MDIVHLTPGETKRLDLPANQRLRITSRCGATAFWRIGSADEVIDDSEFKNDPDTKYLHPSRSAGILLIEGESVFVRCDDVGSRLEIEHDHGRKSHRPKGL